MLCVTPDGAPMNLRSQTLLILAEFCIYVRFVMYYKKLVELTHF